MSGARQSDERGIALIEVIVAVILFALGGLAAASLQLGSTKANQAASNRQIGANLARQLLEAVEALPYSHAALAPTGGTGFIDPPVAVSPANPLNADGQATGGRFFVRRWRVEESPRDPNASAVLARSVNFKTIRVRVTWNQAGRNEQIVMNTIKGWRIP